MSTASVGHGQEEDAREARLQAIRARMQHDAVENIKTLAQIHETKQHFRRLIDPGITRPNNKENTELAIQTLETLSSNLLREPTNPKFQSFKLTNNAIKKRLAEVNGAVEYAVAMGFHFKIHEFQPLYLFNDKHIEDLRLGNEILKEHLEREVEKRQRVTTGISDKEAREAIRRNVQIQFLEDRQNKQARDQKEARRRAEGQAAEAVANTASSPNHAETPHSPHAPLLLPTAPTHASAHAVHIDHDAHEGDNNDEDGSEDDDEVPGRFAFQGAGNKLGREDSAATASTHPTA